jgi:hypothetical protein
MPIDDAACERAPPRGQGIGGARSGFKLRGVRAWLRICNFSHGLAQRLKFRLGLDSVEGHRWRRRFTRSMRRHPTLFVRGKACCDLLQVGD